MQNRLATYGLLALAGVLYGLGYPTEFSTSLLITPMVALIIVGYLIIHAPNWKHRFLRFFFFNSVVNLFSFYWITYTLQEFGQLPWIVALLVNMLFAFIIGPHLWLILILCCLLDMRQKLQFNKLLTQRHHAPILALVLTFFEIYTPNQFPSNLGAPWIMLGKYLGYASIGGLPIYSFFSYWLVLETIRYFYRKQFSRSSLAIILTFIITNPLLALWMKQNSGETKTLNIRMVQANISNFLKIDSEKGTFPSVQQVLKAYRGLSTQPYELGSLDLIIWPETAYPYSIATDKNDLQSTLVPTVFTDIIGKTGAQMFVGGYDERATEDENRYQSEYNSAFHVNESAQIVDVYHKHILIPFGETLPFGPLNKYLRPLVENIAFFSVGTEYPVFEFKNGVRAIGAICYEILESDFIRHYLNRSGKNPELIINLTNDSWYGDTAEPRLHLFMGKWRSVENNVTIVRSTNTGITSVIYPDGSESNNLGIYKAGNLDITLNLAPRNPTIYSYLGIWSLIPLLMLYLIFNHLLLKSRSEQIP